MYRAIALLLALMFVPVPTAEAAPRQPVRNQVGKHRHYHPRKHPRTTQAVKKLTKHRYQSHHKTTNVKRPMIRK